ncbi:E3 ubiquitin-protein ligase ATL23 [Striga hermonthica]|uniref:E3 ubiquitin-protein ligase ATL23 n=1 Tax=Striga hermonthica TaxID=68872 RepID=A0A9N7RKW2_STRHE|nr:E3 ubiquitin-protein ligase ATL23 [Striga hermonthica]
MAILISLLLLVIGIGILILIHVCVVGRTLRQGIIARYSVERGRLGSRSLSRDEIEKLPCFDFQGKDEEKGATSTSPCADCAVCLEMFRAGEKCRLLPLCNHSFHAECVDVWLMKVSVCPICRADLDKSGSLFGEERRSETTGIEINAQENQTGS